MVKKPNGTHVYGSLADGRYLDALLYHLIGVKKELSDCEQHTNNKKDFRNRHSYTKNRIKFI
jgi:hypothetical protein